MLRVITVNAEVTSQMFVKPAMLCNVRLITGKKGKLDSVTPAQWMAASACIPAEVVNETCGDTSQLTRDYIMAHVRKSASWQPITPGVQ